MENDAKEKICRSKGTFIDDIQQLFSTIFDTLTNHVT